MNSQDVETNPFLRQQSNTPFDAVPFSEIKLEHFIPALNKIIQFAKAEIDKIHLSNQVTFDSVIEPLESIENKLGFLTSTFFNLHSANSDEALRDLAKEMSQILTNYRTDINQDERLFKKFQTLYTEINNYPYTPEQKNIIEQEYSGMVRGGALLSSEDKALMREIDQKLSHLSLKFSDHVLKDSQDFVLELTARQVQELPLSLRENLREKARERNLKSEFAVTLDYPIYIPFMEYSQNSNLKKELYTAFVYRGFNGNEQDNRRICQEIARLRYKRAKLLGFDHHAHFVLEKRMANKLSLVEQFLGDLLEKALPKARKEMNEIFEFAKEQDKLTELNQWDLPYYRRLYKEFKSGVDSERLKPYFKLENVIQGAFDTAAKLYGLKFTKNSQLPTYHADVQVFEVYKLNGDFVGLFYADFFPRAGKREGAWMTEYRDQRYVGGKDRRPHVSIVCNFTPSSSNTPSLLTFDEVLTLFHEFGHSLHGLLSNCRYGVLSGTNVYWDFVELPSQIFENWCYEKACLDMFAFHFQTGEKIPESLITAIKNAQSLFEGMDTVRQITFALMDLQWHGPYFISQDKASFDILAFEKKIKDQTQFFEFKNPSIGCISTSFSHIFAGGYSAGYYSYKWAEVLDADAFMAFEETGDVFNSEVAKKFQEHILSKGGTEHPSVLYERFRGRAPSTEALLKRSGLL